MMEMGERADKVSQGWGEMPLYWWCKQLWGGNTDKRGVGGNPSPGCTKKAARGVAAEEKNRKTLKGRSSAG